MRYLGLDFGARRTGAALGDDAIDVVMALDTLESADETAFLNMVAGIAKEKRVDVLAVGLPKLLDGTEGEQARWVRMRAEKLRDVVGLPLVYADERYSSHGAHTKKSADAKAACEIAEAAMRQKKNHY